MTFVLHTCGNYTHNTQLQASITLFLAKYNLYIHKELIYTDS